MRVLMSSSAGYGHVLPMVPLARALLTAGHEVLWATAADGGRLVSDAGVSTVPAGLTRGEILADWQALAAGVKGLTPDRARAYMFPKLFGRIRTPRMAADLLRAAEPWAPDLLVHEQGEFAAPLVAALIGVPSVVHAFGSVVPPDDVAATAAEVAPLWAAHGLTVPAYAGCYDTLYLDIYPASLQPDRFGHIPHTQPLRPIPYTGEESGPVPLPPGEDPLVYLTLGTVFNNPTVLTGALAALATMNVRVIVTVGPTGDLATVGPQPPQILVERYVSQSDLLPLCAAVVSHAGSGTVLGTLGLGLPQVCLPQAADQFRNAEAVVGAGAGVSLRPDDSSADAIANAVRAVLDDDSYRVAAGRVAEEIAQMPAPAEVVPRLEQVAAR